MICTVFRHTLNAFAAFALVSAVANNSVLAQTKYSPGLETQLKSEMDYTSPSQDAVKKRGKAPTSPAKNKGADVQVIQQLLNATGRDETFRTNDRVMTMR